MEVFRTKSCLKNIEYQNSYLEENQDKFCLENLNLTTMLHFKKNPLKLVTFKQKSS